MAHPTLQNHLAGNAPPQSAKHQCVKPSKKPCTEKVDVRIIYYPKNPSVLRNVKVQERQMGFLPGNIPESS